LAQATVFDGNPATSRKRAQPPQSVLAHVYCGQTAGWMKTPLGTEVDLDPGHIVLDGVPALRKMGTAALFSAHVCCGHGHPSQLLLSSCITVVYAVIACLSVCLSVTSRCSTETGKRGITLRHTIAHAGTLLFWCRRSRQNSNGVTPNGGAKHRWVG